MGDDIRCQIRKEEGGYKVSNCIWFLGQGGEGEGGGEDYPNEYRLITNRLLTGNKQIDNKQTVDW